MERVAKESGASQGGLGSEVDYLRAAGYDGVARLTWAAMCFSLLTLLLFYRDPSEHGGLIALKVLFSLGLAATSQALARRRIPLQYFHGVVLTLVILCLSLSLVTASSGFTEHFEVYAVLLILGCAVAEVSMAWATLEWTLIWLSWLVALRFFPSIAASDHLLIGIGAQLIAIPTLSMRARLFRDQYRFALRLSDALSESEKVRANLDREVDRRTRELSMAYEELNLSVKERERLADERERLHAQFLQSQKMESLGRLAGGVAHDFNNLLTVIMGNIHLAQVVSKADVELAGLLNEASTAVKRAAEVTGHLLAFSRSKVLTFADVSVQKVVQESLKMIQRLLGEDIKLEVDLCCPDSVVAGDSTQLQQVLLNLAVNARDAMPKGGLLRIELYQDKNSIVMRISDSGTGIPPDIQQRIFEPFFTSKPVGKGTGLGLSTVHGIVSMHNGTVEVDSRPGEGATFTVRLPARRANLDESSGNRALPVVSGSGRILLVEDDAQVRALAVRALEKAGYHVQPFENGNALLNCPQELGDCDMLVTDVVMPGIDGASLARRALVQRPDLPVLFMSGYADDKLSAFDLDQGRGFLAKPFTPLELQAAVSHVLETRVAAC